MERQDCALDFLVTIFGGWRPGQLSKNVQNHIVLQIEMQLKFLSRIISL
jgi:hypothetical protein